MVSTTKVFALLAPETSTPSIARTRDALAVEPTRLTLEPVLNPAPPATTLIWLMNPEKTSEIIASAVFVAPPPVTTTESPTL